MDHFWAEQNSGTPFRDQSNPVDSYLFKPPHYLKEGESVQIPVAGSEIRTYTKKQGTGWMTTNRDINDYNSLLFSDECEEIESLNMTDPSVVRPRTDQSQTLFGGIDGAMAAGKVVVDVGSGEAMALLHYSKYFQETTFIGVDQGYNKGSSPLDLKRKGVQLLPDDWQALLSLPDRSVDTFLALEGPMRHGDTEAAIQAITRTAKDGAILRYNTYLFPGLSERVTTILEKNGWDVTHAPKGDIAVKKARS